MIKLDINIGDTILVGRFKNKRIEVKEIGVDEHGGPTVNGRSILKIRIEKLMKIKLKEDHTNRSGKHFKNIRNLDYDVDSQDGVKIAKHIDKENQVKHKNLLPDGYGYNVGKLDSIRRLNQNTISVGGVYIDDHPFSRSFKKQELEKILNKKLIYIDSDREIKENKNMKTKKNLKESKQFKMADVVKKILKENSYDDFLTSYGKDIQKALQKIKSIAKAIKKSESYQVPNAGDDIYPDDLIDKIQNKLSAYDKGVEETIDHFINNAGHLTVRDIAAAAHNNFSRYGTEMKMFLYAIDDYYDAIASYDGQIANYLDADDAE